MAWKLKFVPTRIKTGFANFIIAASKLVWGPWLYAYYWVYYSIVYGLYYYTTYYLPYYYYVADEDRNPPGTGDDSWQAYIEARYSYATIDRDYSTLMPYGLPTGSTTDVYAQDSGVTFSFIIGTDPQGHWNLFAKSKYPPWIIPMTSDRCQKMRTNDPAVLGASTRYLYSGKVGNHTLIDWPIDPAPLAPIFVPYSP